MLDCAAQGDFEVRPAIWQLKNPVLGSSDMIGEVLCEDVVSNCCAGALYGTYEAFRNKVPGLYKIRFVGQTTLQSAAVRSAFSPFMKTRI